LEEERRRNVIQLKADFKKIEEATKAFEQKMKNSGVSAPKKAKK